MHEWSEFFLGELGAAAALAGLLFVSVSVNQARILSLAGVADRGLEALGMLFLVIVVATLPLIPGQSFRLLGAEIVLSTLLVLAVLIPIELKYLRQIDPKFRHRSINMVRGNRTAVALIVLAGATLAWRNDGMGLYLMPVGILLSFFMVGANAWVLLIEINR